MREQHDEIVRDWRDNAAGNEDRNYRFLRRLKMVSDPERLDDQVRGLHQEVFAAVDCPRCANCCKTMKPNVTAADIERIAEHLGLSPAAFIADYLEADPEDGSYRMRALPCPFLAEDGRCRIYEHRPLTCREFPHTDKEGFIWRVYGVAANTLNCPAVYRIVERLRQQRGRRL